MILVKCISNTSASLPFVVGNTYQASDIGGAFKIYATTGSINDHPKATMKYIIAPLVGHFVKFEKVKK